MGCVIPHQSNAVNIPHQTNAGLRNITFDIQQYPPLPYEFLVIGIF
jgi:hypothetical protein